MLDKIKLKKVFFCYNAKLENRKETSSGTKSKKEIQTASSERASKPREPWESGARHMLEARREGGRRDLSPSVMESWKETHTMKPAAKKVCLVYKPGPSKLMPAIQEGDWEVGCWEISTLRLLWAEVWGSNVYCQGNTEIQAETLTLKVVPSSSRTAAWRKLSP